MKTYLITGGAGFIGCNFIKFMFDKYEKLITLLKYHIIRLIIFLNIPFGDKELDGANVVYEEIRNMLFEMNLDIDNFNAAKWNPSKKD